jgi:hypothetical protein
MSGVRLDIQIADSMMKAIHEAEKNRAIKVDDIMIDILMHGELTAYGTPVLSFENLFRTAIEAAQQMISEGSMGHDDHDMNGNNGNNTGTNGGNDCMNSCMA